MAYFRKPIIEMVNLRTVDLSILTRWQIIDNLRRSLLSPSLYLIILLALTVLPGSPLKWIIIADSNPFFTRLSSILSIQNIYQNLKGFFIRLDKYWCEFITLPFQTVLLLDAIVRTLYRLQFQRSNLLEWTHLRKKSGISSQRRKIYVYGLYGGYLLTSDFLPLSALFHGNTAVQSCFPVISFFMGMYSINGQMVKQTCTVKRAFPFQKRNQRNYGDLSREIWSFYEDYVTEEDSWLPPDNVQMDPPNGIAHRTSPTNIGLYLSCALAARDFNFIDTPGLIERLERTLHTIDTYGKMGGSSLQLV